MGITLGFVRTQGDHAEAAPIEPGNLTRAFALRARRAGLRVIPLCAEESEEEVRAALGELSAAMGGTARDSDTG